MYRTDEDSTISNEMTQQQQQQTVKIQIKVLKPRLTKNLNFAFAQSLYLLHLRSYLHK